MYGYLPQQQIIQVNGKASVDQIQMMPNSSILLMDTTAPVVWMCVSDGVGRVTATPFDITEHVENPLPDVTEQRLEAIEQAIKNLEVKLDERKQSDVRKATGRSKQQSIPD